MPLSREFKVGLFVSCTGLVILIALLYLAIGKGVFEKMHVFTLSSRSGEGFTEGMPVVFSGFNIGKVHDLELSDTGIVLIKIKIPDRHIKWIRSDSTFVLYRPLIGSARIVINTPNLNSLPLEKSKISEVSTINDINDAITKVEPVLEKLSKITDNIELLTRNLSNPKGDLNQTLENARIITSNFASKKSLVEMAVGDEESVKSIQDALKKLKDIATNIDRIVQKVDKMADKTDDHIFGREGTLSQVNIILKDVSSKLQKLDKSVDNINNISSEASEGVKDIRYLRSDIDDAVKSIDDAAQKIEALIGPKKNPEIKTP